jgi:CBS domain-containing protein
MKLQELTDREVVTVSPQGLIRETAEKMAHENVGAVVVVDGERHVVGIVTDRDIALALATQGVSPESAIASIMTRNVVTIWEDQALFDVTQYFWGHRIRRLPIIDREDRLVGMLSVDDLFGLLTRELFNAAHALEPALGERI